MVLTGPRKAALLLMSLHPATAAELLKAAGAETVREIAAELACLSAVKKRPEEAAADSVREFLGLLGKARDASDGEGFVRQILRGALGAERSEEVLAQAQEMAALRDPFLPVRSAAVEDVAAALAGESPQVVALVLSELPPKKSGKLLTLLEEGLRGEAIKGMTGVEGTSLDVKQRVAEVMRSRLEARGAEEQERPEERGDERKRQQLRKVAVLLRGLSADIRTGLLSAISEQNAETGAAVRSLMITWEDISIVADRSLQEALRAADTRQIATALVEADEAIVRKVRDNVSERQRQMIDEETSLLSSPKPEEIEEARENVLSSLRQMNENNMVSFEDE